METKLVLCYSSLQCNNLYSTVKPEDAADKLVHSDKM